MATGHEGEAHGERWAWLNFNEFTFSEQTQFDTGAAYKGCRSFDHVPAHTSAYTVVPSRADEKPGCGPGLGQQATSTGHRQLKTPFQQTSWSHFPLNLPHRATFSRRHRSDTPPRGRIVSRLLMARFGGLERSRKSRIRSNSKYTSPL